MKKIILANLFFICFLSTSLKTVAQPVFRFTFDDSGNRVKRELVDLNDPEPDDPDPQDAVIESSKDSPVVEAADYKFSAASGDEEFFVFPNPVQDQLTLLIPNSKNYEDINWAIFTEKGTLLQKSIETIGTENTIDMSKAVPGSYILRLNIDSRSKEWIILKD